jgi:hypothetical protein
MTQSSGMTLSELAMYSLTVILILTITLSALAAIIAIIRAPEIASVSLKDFFNGGDALKILTVFAILITAAYLALANQLSEAAIALLSSISGYVLGKLSGTKPISENEEN